MNSKLELAYIALGAWVVAALTLAALPVAHSVSALRELGTLVPMFSALAFSMVAGIPLLIVVRRLCGMPVKSDSNAWADTTRGQAAALGVVGWGVPVGLMLAAQNFVTSGSYAESAPSLVTMPLAGIAFGLTLRWIMLRREHRGSAQGCS